QNDQEEDYSTILAEKKKKLTNSYASHADMPDSLGLLKPKQKAKVLIIKSSKTSSPVGSRNHSADNLSSSFYDRIAEKMIQRDKKEREKEKAKFTLDTESSNNNSSTSESEEEEEETTTTVAATSSTTTSTTQERNETTTVNTPSSQTVVANAVKYLNSSKHRMNKYNSDFPSLSGSSSSAAAFLASTSNNNNNPYDRSSQKNKFKPMSQKLKSQEEFPSLQSSNRKKNNQIKQPRSKGNVLRIV
ncbi:hypothetical protein PIROE2DRAFT_67457, partial [Piromyces sp. E2]